MSKTETLDKIYNDPANLGVFSSQRNLLQNAKLLRNDISLKDVKEYLSSHLPILDMVMCPISLSRVAFSFLKEQGFY